MGRYKQRGVIIRDFEDVTIVIENRDTIWALPKRASTNVIFHRWFGPLNTWQNWRRFRQRIWANRNLTLYDCYRLANKWEIAMVGTLRRPEILEEIQTHATIAKRRANEHQTIQGHARGMEPD